MAIHFSRATSLLNEVLVAHSEQGICAILLGDTRQSVEAELKASFPAETLIESKPCDSLKQIIDYIAQPKQSLKLVLDIQGTVLQRLVWSAIAQIPLGETASYSDLALRIGKPTAVRALASACAANKLAIAIPCHRVIRKDGGLSGYRWGLSRKATLLQREAAAFNNL